MRRLFTFFALLLGAISFVGCSSDDTPSGGTQPKISISTETVTPDSFTFKVTTSEAGTIGYAVVAEGYETPKVNQWFTENSKEVKKSEIITISNLNDNVNYTLYAIFRAKNSGNLSDPQKIEFTTPDDGIVNPIVVHNATYNTINFSINVQGDYLFQCIDEPSIKGNWGITIEEYIEMPGIGIPATGPIEVEWVNGGYWGAFEMRVREDCNYYIVVALPDGKVIYETTHTPKRPSTTADVTVDISNIAPTSATIKTTPDNTVSTYYVYVDTKKWSDNIVQSFGTSMLESLVERSNAISWELTKTNEGTWGNLRPSTIYICHVLIKDSKGGKTLKLVPFTTSGPTLPAPTAEATLTPATENGYCTLKLSLSSPDAVSVRLICKTKPEIDSIRAKKEYDDSLVVATSDWTLNAEQMAEVNSTGLSFAIEDLFPGLEYIAIISFQNSEFTETLKVVSCTTPAKPVPARVESNLFTSLLGEWEVSYPLYQFNNRYVSLQNASVTIAQGADDNTADYYRSYNRLVVQGWPFNVEADGTHNKIQYLSPTDLAEYSTAWKNYPALALRDYGPKIFLEIGEGDVITVPSSPNEYFYNWSSDGTFYFFGGDLQNGFTAPSTFPVTLSEDGNTLTIGAQCAGEEFDNGTYRPSVFRNNLDDYRAVATGDVILKRVK